MALRCFLFSSDEGTVANLRQILDALGVDAEPCSDAVKAAEKITNQSFQIVIIDWDQQPEAGVLLSTARERKAAERPLTLAIVSNDAGAPQALQAGANSLLRKPIALNQARETLTTARDLLRAKQGSAAIASQAAAAAASGSSAAGVQGNAAALRAGEFLQTPTLAPGGHFETEAPLTTTHEQPPAINPLKDLEPMAASVSRRSTPLTALPEPVAPPPGLQSYLKSRLAAPQAPTAPPPVLTASRGNPELATYAESSSYSARSAPAAKSAERIAAAPIAVPKPEPPTRREQQKEAELFAYMQGERDEPEQTPAAALSLKKRAIVVALVLAGFAIIAAPQAPWHSKLSEFWRGTKQSAHAWLYPQPVTPTQDPAAHESFGRAGDEYKLPVAENIPDSTTDPSQIQVVPVIDPTAKKPTSEAAQPDQSTAQPDQGSSPDASPQSPGAQSPAVQPQVNPTPQAPAATAQPNVATAVPPPSSSAVSTVASSALSAPVHPDTSATATTSFPTPVTAPPKYAQPRAPSMPGHVPSSLKSQLASMTPDAGGNKSPDAAMPSIEPVSVTEAAERALLTDQPALAYPPNAKGQQGTVVLQILIGRDGSVQDAKFLQGSLVFARSAIDGVKQWKFKPYMMNGRPVSVQTPLTIKFNLTQ